jgi:WD40-like Beta Propeller Repeat
LGAGTEEGIMGATRARRLKALGAVAALAVVAAAGGPGVGAQDEEGPSRFAFGTVGITRTQTARVSVVATGLPSNPSEPCRVTVEFLDATGQPIGGRAGGGTAQVLTLDPGITASADVSGVEALAGIQENRAQILPAVQVPPGPCADAELMASLEVIGADENTEVFWQAPPLGDLATGPGSFGPVGITRTQTARLSLVALAHPSGPCVATVRFLDEVGQPIGGPEGAVLTLEEPNVVAFTDLTGVEALPGGKTARTEVLPTIQDTSEECTPSFVMATLEVFDASGSTAHLWSVSRPVPFFPAPSCSGNGKIAFSYHPAGGGPDGIFTVNPNGTDRTQLTTGLFDRWPSWSPFGNRIAFSRDGDIWMMDADGTDQTRLTTNIEFKGDPAWSPGGNKVAFESGGSIYVMDADGTDTVKLTNGVNDMQPAWSPDGSKIAFVRRWIPASNGGDIRVMDADGTDQVRLTFAFYDTAPDWSPDGSRIAFYRDSKGLTPTAGGIYVMDADGTNKVLLHPDSVELDFQESPVWSPDGTRIVFAAYPGEIWTMDVDGADLIKVTSPTDFADNLNEKLDWQRVCLKLSGPGP